MKLKSFFFLGGRDPWGLFKRQSKKQKRNTIISQWNKREGYVCDLLMRTFSNQSPFFRDMTLTMLETDVPVLLCWDFIYGALVQFFLFRKSALYIKIMRMMKHTNFNTTCVFDCFILKLYKCIQQECNYSLSISFGLTL